MVASVDELLAHWRQAQQDLVVQYSDQGLSTLANMVGSGTIDVAPTFQRRDRWSATKQSALIESFMLNLPIPPIYLAEEAGGKYAVIDGRQRLTAISTFFDNKLTLSGLSSFPELEGYSFSTLPAELRSALAMRPLRSVTLLSQTDPELKYTVFHRLNTAGEVLNAQEIRNVVYRGPMNDLVHDLSRSPFLARQLKITSEMSSSFRKMQDVEFVLRYLTLADNWEEFSGDLSLSMDIFMHKHEEPTGASLEAFRSDFIRSLSSAERLWGGHAFQRPEGGAWRSQALAGLYDAEMVALHLLDDKQIGRLDSRKATKAVVDLFKDPEFDQAVRVGTNTPSRVRYRIQRLTEALAK